MDGVISLCESDMLFDKETGQFVNNKTTFDASWRVIPVLKRDKWEIDHVPEAPGQTIPH